VSPCVRELLKELTRQSQVGLECEAALGDIKVYCEAFARPLRPLMIAIPRSMAPEGRGLQWTKTASGYRLEVDPAALKSVRRDEENAERHRLDILRSAVYFTEMTPSEQAAALATSRRTRQSPHRYQGKKHQ